VANLQILFTQILGIDDIPADGATPGSAIGPSLGSVSQSPLGLAPDLEVPIGLAPAPAPAPVQAAL